jgi:hypothetical protein
VDCDLPERVLKSRLPYAVPQPWARSNFGSRNRASCRSV